MGQIKNAFFEKLNANPFVYHYTSIDAIFSILEESRKGRCGTLPFWAGSVYQANDLRELTLGYDTVKSILPQFEKNKTNSVRLSDVYGNYGYEMKCKEQTFKRPIDKTTGMARIPYIISFSCKRDFLPMWSMYGNGKRGVCLKFRLSKLIESLDDIQLCFVHYEGEDTNVINDYLLPILYDCGTKGIIDLSVEEKIRELSLLCDCISPFVKTKEWAYESEFRIVRYKHNGGESSDSFIKCLQLSFKEHNIEDHIPLPINANAMEEIIIGPLANYDVVEHILRNELKECLLNDVLITPSSIEIIK